MRKLLLLVITLSGAAPSFSQNRSSEDVVRRVADNIISNTSFQYVNTRTGQKYSTLTDVAPTPDMKAESQYNKWAYVNGVLAIGMMQTAAQLRDKKYSDYARRNYDFIFNGVPYFEPLYKAKTPRVEFNSFFAMGNLDACGAMAAGLSDVYELDKRSDYRAYLDRAADYILNKQARLADNTLCRPAPRRMTIWADDLFMSVPFLARMGKLTGNGKYFDDAIRQVKNFNRYLYDPATSVFFHNYYSDVATNGVGHWGRANGWLAVAQCQLLNALPPNHPKRAELISLLLRQIVGFARLQDQSGLWHQLLDKPDSYLETSATAMFTYAVAHAVNEGWIAPGYIAIAREGWRGLCNKVTADGQLQDVCIGTNMEDDIKFYYTRPTELNDTHGLGALLLAGAEMIRYERDNKK